MHQSCFTQTQFRATTESAYSQKVINNNKLEKGCVPLITSEPNIWYLPTVVIHKEQYFTGKPKTLLTYLKAHQCPTQTI